MNLHANAALSLKGRRELCLAVVERERTLTQAAEAAGVSVRCARKWVGRYRARASPGCVIAPRRRTGSRTGPASSGSRRSRRCGGCGSPARRSPRCLDMPLSTVSGILTRIGMGKLGRLGLEPAVRYERERPGELIHIDIKRLGRIQRGAGCRFTGPAARSKRPTRKDPLGVRRQTAGWECVHIAIDDCTRLAYAEVLADQSRRTVIGFLRRAVAFYARHGITVQRVLTDNGGAYRSTIHAAACRTLGIRHLRTRAYRPQTNGKAERFIRTLLAGWAYGAIYRSSAERTAALDGWLWHYNHHRKHSALGHQPPIARLNERNQP